MINNKNLKSPISGSPIVQVKGNVYKSEYDDYYYILTKNGEVIPLVSISGSPIEPVKENLWKSSSDDYYYIVTNDGKIIILKSPETDSTLQPRGNGVYYSEFEKQAYTLDSNGNIVKIMSAPKALRKINKQPIKEDQIDER